jgi:hypothetical protein
MGDLIVRTHSTLVLVVVTVLYDFQDAFKKWQKLWERCIRAEGTTSRLIVVSRSKVSFDRMAAPGPEIMDGSLYVVPSMR